jgi:hypothetical protein
VLDATFVACFVLRGSLAVLGLLVELIDSWAHFASRRERCLWSSRGWKSKCRGGEWKLAHIFGGQELRAGRDRGQFQGQSQEAERRVSRDPHQYAIMATMLIKGWSGWVDDFAKYYP